MPKFTYPVVFVRNEQIDGYNAYIPDLGITSVGETMEDAYESAERMQKHYFEILLAEDFDIPIPTSLEDVSAKWKDYKVSLLTANIPDPK